MRSRTGGRKFKDHCAECDRTTIATQERLLAELLEHMGVPPRDYKAATLWFAERYVPAFKKAGKRGGKLNYRGKLQLLAAMDQAKEEDSSKTDIAILSELFP